MVEMVTKFPVKMGTKTMTAPYSTSRYPMDSLRRSIDRLFADFDMGFLPTPMRRPFFDYEPAVYAKSYGWPVVDVSESPQGFEIRAELPGVDEKDIEVKVADQTLWITGQKKEEVQEKNTGYVMNERSFGAFERAFSLPEGVEAEKIVATFSKGVLTVALPKTHQAKQQERKISVKAA